MGTCVVVERMEVMLPPTLEEPAAPLAQFEDSRLLRSAVKRAQLVRLAVRGLDAKAAAQVVGMHPQTVAAIFRDPSFRRAALGKLEDALGGADASFAERKKSLHERLEEQAEKSFEALCEMLEKQELGDGLRVKIHQDFLDRNPETMSGQKITMQFDTQQLATAAMAAREMSGVIELTPVDAK